MPSRITKAEKMFHFLEIFKERGIQKVEECLKDSELSKSAMNLCREFNCAELRQDGSSRCKNHKK